MLDAQLCGPDNDRRRVARTELRGGRTDVDVSTVFLMLDHNHFGDGPPVLWETMTFSRDPRIDGHQERYTSREVAEIGHAAYVDWAKLQLRIKRRSSRRLAVIAKRIAKTGSPYRQKKQRRAA